MLPSLLMEMRTPDGPRWVEAIATPVYGADRAELLLGHGALEPDEIRTGIARLATVLRAR